MKSEEKRWGRAWFLLMSLILLGGCGSSASSGSNLNDGDDGTGITNTFTSPSQLGVGDIMAVEFGDSTEVTVDFSGVASGTNFILSVGSYNSSGSGTSMQLSADLALPESEITRGMLVADGDEGAVDEDSVYGPQEIMSAWLRASEAALPSTEVPLVGSAPASFSKSMNMGAKAAALGATETLKVLSSLTSTTSTVNVTGKVRCVGTNVVFYVDTSVGSDKLSDSDVASLCSEFDTAAGTEFSLLGGASDVDGDGKVHVLMTKQINLLGAMGGGIITGYFYAGDLYAGSNSNYREIIYTMVPDPLGEYGGTAISRDFAMSNLLPAVLPHELQHAISYNQHVFVNSSAPEENWLNEGMSHLVEDVLGYGVENPSRYAMYLSSPSTYGVVTQGSPNLMERGAAYLFLRFLYEQASDGAAFLKALEDTTENGVENLEAAFNGPSNMNEFQEFLARWTVALAMTNRGISSDGRYIYEARTKNSTTGNWEGVCLDCDPEDNRGTALAGVHLNTYNGSHKPNIDASTSIFYEITTVPGQIRLAGTQGGGNFGVLVRTQ